MGEMLLLYAASDVAFVGGSLVPTGSHNMLEPAALGKPVLFGPHRYNFAEISQLLIDQKAAQEVADSTVLSQAVVKLLQNRELRLQQGGQGKAVVEQNRGALKRMSDKIQTLLAL
jgi:3-deoxy-D-manno-octulosonic-acid transferase